MSPSATVRRFLSQVIELSRFIWSHPSNRGRRGRAILRLVAWQTWQRVVRRPWTVRLVSQTRLVCYPHNASGSGVIYCGMIEWRDVHFVKDFLHSGDAFVDIGANIGVYSLIAASTLGVRVCALEPSKESYDRLLENLELNAVTGVITRRIAAGRIDDMGRLTMGHDTTNHLLWDDSSEDPGAETVEIRAMDSLLPELGISNPALIKIDVEGWELEVLAGLIDTISAYAPSLIVEWNDAVRLREMLTRAGDTICVDTTPTHDDSSTLRMLRSSGTCWQYRTLMQSTHALVITRKIRAEAGADCCEYRYCGETNGPSPVSVVDSPMPQAFPVKASAGLIPKGAKGPSAPRAPVT